ncbi:hypothetical protein BGZ83_003883, partial [Gryganskiella cystojenkinii]
MAQGHFPTPATPPASPPVYLSHPIPEPMTSEEPTLIRTEKAAAKDGQTTFPVDESSPSTRAVPQKRQKRQKKTSAVGAA